ncbi:MAG: molybdopterin-dependent oxidoreductase [Candidatus Acidiferrales bacterium]
MSLCRAGRLVLSLATILTVLSPSLRLSAQEGASNATLKVDGDVEKPLTLSAADLKKMPRKTLQLTNPHSGKNEAYEGVALDDLLRAAGVPLGDKLRGPAMATYVLARAEDGYRVVFSLAELDPAFLDSEVVVADTMDGAPLGPKEGPFKIVAPHEKRPARWVRMLGSLTVVQIQ